MHRLIALAPHRLTYESSERDPPQAFQSVSLRCFQQSSYKLPASHLKLQAPMPQLAAA